MDAFAYIIEMLDMGLRYFEPQWKEESAWDIENEYKELMSQTEPAIKQSDFAII